MLPRLEPIELIALALVGIVLWTAVFVLLHLSIWLAFSLQYALAVAWFSKIKKEASSAPSSEIQAWVQGSELLQNFSNWLLNRVCWVLFSLPLVGLELWGYLQGKPIGQTTLEFERFVLAEPRFWILLFVIVVFLSLFFANNAYYYTRLQKSRRQ